MQPIVDQSLAPAGTGPYIQTTAGDWERETRSRRFNGVEALGVYMFILAVLWPYGYLFGYLGGNDLIAQSAWTMLTLGALYVLFVSPFIHRDTLDSWGLGGPRHTLQLLQRATPARRNLLIGVIAFLWAGLNVVNYLRWPDVARFLQLHKITLGGVPGREFHEHMPHVLLVVLTGLVLSSLIVFCAIRYDNFGSAFKTAMKIALPLVAVVFVGAYLASLYAGTRPFDDFSITKYSLDVFGYVFWGFTQQLLFSAYFGTRFRKAFAPSVDPDNVVPRDRRVVFGMGIGLAIGASLSLLFFGLIRFLYPPEESPLVLILWMFVFITPFGVLWGYFYGKDKRRLLVATLSGSLFGLIHIDSYGLVAATFLLGVFLTYVFMEEKNRNLVALGFIHGLLGSTFGWLFSSGHVGSLEIDYSVGPAGVNQHGLGVVVFPVLCIVAYAGVAWWIWRNANTKAPRILPEA